LRSILSKVRGPDDPLLTSETGRPPEGRPTCHVRGPVGHDPRTALARRPIFRLAGFCLRRYAAS